MSEVIPSAPPVIPGLLPLCEHKAFAASTKVDRHVGGDRPRFFVSVLLRCTGCGVVFAPKPESATVNHEFSDKPEYIPSIVYQAVPCSGDPSRGKNSHPLLGAPPEVPEKKETPPSDKADGAN